MKRYILAAVALMALCAITARAGLDVYDSVTVHNLGHPAYVAADTTVTNTAVDVAGAKGIGNLIVFIGAAATNDVTYMHTVTLEHSAASGSGFYTVTNGAGVACVFTCGNSNGVGQVQSVKLEAEMLKRYLRLKGAAENDGGNFSGAFLISK